jgi:tetratricopeptide (TPR) repeat protein
MEPWNAQAQTVADLTLRYSDAYNRGDFETAENVAQQAIIDEADQVGQSSPDLIPFRRDLAMIEAAAGQTQQAIEQLRTLVNEAQTAGYRSTLASLLFDLASVLRDFGRGAEAASLFDQALRIELEVGLPVQVRGAGGVASAGGIATVGPRIAASYWDLFSRTERELSGFGRYTYVLFPFASEEGGRFLTRLLHVTNPIGGIALPRDRLNLFYVPVRPGEADVLRSTGVKPGHPDLDLDPKSILSSYDYEYASEILISYCLRAEPRPRDCDNARGPGPFILTLPEPWSAAGDISSAAVLVNMSGSDARVQEIVVDAIRKAAENDQPSGPDRMAHLRITIANSLIQAGAIAEKLAEEMPTLTKLIRR